MSKKTDILRILLHGFFLVSTNLFSVMAAFVAVKMLSLPTERIIQSSIALVINVIIYIVVFRIMAGIQKGIMGLDNFSMMITVLLISLALLPAVFYPLHYLTQGYWSSFNNLMATWPFQLLVNGICLVLNYFIFSTKE